MLETQGLITADPDVAAGKPVVRGTRIAVEFVIGLLVNGWTEAQILENYPSLDREKIKACLIYARDILAEEKVYPSAA